MKVELFIQNACLWEKVEQFLFRIIFPTQIWERNMLKTETVLFVLRSFYAFPSWVRFSKICSWNNALLVCLYVCMYVEILDSCTRCQNIGNYWDFQFNIETIDFYQTGHYAWKTCVWGTDCGGMDHRHVCLWKGN